MMTKKVPKVFYFKRSFQLAALSSNNTSDQAAGIYFSLDAVPNYTEFTGLFDSYKIMAVKLEFLPQVNSMDPDRVSGTTRFCGAFYHAIDLNDVAPPASANEVLQYQYHKISDPLKRISRYIRPKPAVAAYSGAFTSYATGNNWIDTASPSVQYYGFKYFWTQTINAEINIIPVATYYMKFKSYK